MAVPTQPLRDEHKDLWPNVERLSTTADAVGQVSVESLRRSVDEAYDFLTSHLVPHAQAEERALYPVVAKFMGAPEATATMSRDHVEIGSLTEELRTLRAGLSGAALDVVAANRLRRVLYGLCALLKVHFAKEEEIYLPLLDSRLTAAAAREMFEAMEAAAAEAKQSTPSLR